MLSKRFTGRHRQNTALTIQDFPLAGRTQVTGESSSKWSIGELRWSTPQEMGQVVAVGVVGSAKFLFNAHVEVKWRAVERRSSLHDGRMRLHMRRVDGGRGTDTERRVRVRERRSYVVGRGHRCDWGVCVLSLVNCRG